MLEIIKQALGEGWEFSSAGGITGNAYIAKRADERLFLKRNTSPFLAVLSAEGIVPQLIWTKRLKNGDVITAQKWLDGRELYPSEMKDERVAKKLRQIHESSELLYMLMRLGIQPMSPADKYENLYESLHKRNLPMDYPLINESLVTLKKLLPDVEGHEQVVCHADINHNNLMYSADDSLYIVDWDHATIADPAKDFGTILYEYIPETNWTDWLQHYGISKDESLIKRVYWYLLEKFLTDIMWYVDHQQSNATNEYLMNIEQLNTRFLSQV
ncbi:MAG TPA: phosphotransferase family protein [Bacillota bacterium]|nr:phosphotransferase family protein [Bacillota bacterium]